MVLATFACSVAAADTDERYQTSNVVDLTSFSNKGAAWLIRSKNGIDGRMMSNVPTAGDPYTLWVIVFNNTAYSMRPTSCITKNWTSCGKSAAKPISDGVPTACSTTSPEPAPEAVTPTRDKVLISPIITETSAP